MINLQFTSKRHKHHFNVEKEYINANNKKLLAAIYLLTADKNVWMQCRRHIEENDIDFENCIIHITKDMVMDENKNWGIKIPKTLASIRDIKVPPEIIESIKRNGLYKGHPNSISDWMTKAEKRLGIPHFSLHKTRHFFVSVAHNKGESDADIMATGGWATDNVMIKHYRQARSTSEKIVGTVTDGLF